jgi:hypothetical protein
MLRLGVSLTIFIVLSNAACAQHASGPQAQQGAGNAVEDACRQEVRRICSVGFPPNVRRCIADNQDKLSAPCRALIRERQKSTTHSPR